MDIREIKKAHWVEYDNFVLSCKGNLIYYSLKYRRLVDTVAGCRSVYYGAYDRGELVGVLPLFYKDGSYGRIYNSSAYYGSHGGILTERADVVEMLVDCYNMITRRKGVAASTLIENPLVKLDYGGIGAKITDHRIGQITFLPSADGIQNFLSSSVHAKTRNMVRKAEKSKLSISIDNSCFEFLEKTHNQNMTVLGGLVKGSEFFKSLQKIFSVGEEYEIFVASQGAIPCAALLLLYYGDTVEYFMPVIKKEYRSLQPLSLIIVHAMKRACERGVKIWNWGGTWQSQEGVYRFKNRWAAKDFPYTYYTTVNNNRLFFMTRDELISSYPDFYVVPYEKLVEVS